MASQYNMVYGILSVQTKGRTGRRRREHVEEHPHQLTPVDLDEIEAACWRSIEKNCPVRLRDIEGEKYQDLLVFIPVRWLLALLDKVREVHCE